MLKSYISEYSHTNNIYTDSKGILHLSVDCSGFVAWWLKENGFLRALAQIRMFLKEQGFIKTNRFFCQDFLEFLKTQPKYWQVVKTPQPNDIIVVVFPDSNGHCMIIDSILTDTKYRVLDSTRFPHEQDTRTNGSTGVGYGNIEIINDCYNSKNPSKPIRQAKIFFIRPMK